MNWAAARVSSATPSTSSARARMTVTHSPGVWGFVGTGADGCT
ncbi:hypothetical protein [Deinococcus arboris]|nr:hypothetical protein [Deinococcus arboris]